MFQIRGHSCKKESSWYPWSVDKYFLAQRCFCFCIVQKQRACWMVFLLYRGTSSPVERKGQITSVRSTWTKQKGFSDFCLYQLRIATALPSVLIDSVVFVFYNKIDEETFWFIPIPWCNGYKFWMLNPIQKNAGHMVLRLWLVFLEHFYLFVELFKNAI